MPYWLEYTATALRSLKTIPAFYRAWARREVVYSALIENGRRGPK